MTNLNYMQEETQLQDKNYWKPKSGTFKITFKDECQPLTESKFTKQDGTVEIRKQTNVKIKDTQTNEEYLWSISQASSRSSLFGQIVRLANQNAGRLTGVNATIIIKNDGKKRDFTVLEVNQ